LSKRIYVNAFQRALWLLLALAGAAHASDEFVATNPPITPAEWENVLDEVKSAPGARTTQTGPKLMVIHIESPSAPASYMFTQPAHPAHPAYIKISPANPSGKPVKIEGNYAGSKVEFENWVRSFVAYANEQDAKRRSP
jgi:hypothetical protein